MKQRKNIKLAFEVDQLTNSIESAISNEVFNTVVTPIEPTGAKQIKKKDWTFDWQIELKDKPNKFIS